MHFWSRFERARRARRRGADASGAEAFISHLGPARRRLEEHQDPPRLQYYRRCSACSIMVFSVSWSLLCIKQYTLSKEWIQMSVHHGAFRGCWILLMSCVFGNESRQRQRWRNRIRQQWWYSKSSSVLIKYFLIWCSLIGSTSCIIPVHACSSSTLSLSRGGCKPVNEGWRLCTSAPLFEG